MVITHFLPIPQSSMMNSSGLLARWDFDFRSFSNFNNTFAFHFISNRQSAQSLTCIMAVCSVKASTWLFIAGSKIIECSMSYPLLQLLTILPHCFPSSSSSVRNDWRLTYFPFVYLYSLFSTLFFLQSIRKYESFQIMHVHTCTYT